MQRPNQVNPPSNGIYRPPQRRPVPTPPPVLVWPCPLPSNPHPTPSNSTRTPYRPLATPLVYPNENRERAFPPALIQQPPTSGPVSAVYHTPATRREGNTRPRSDPTNIRTGQPPNAQGDAPLNPTKPETLPPLTFPQPTFPGMQRQNQISSSSSPSGSIQPRPPTRYDSPERFVYPTTTPPTTFESLVRAESVRATSTRAGSPHPDSQAYDLMFRPDEENRQREYHRQRTFADSITPHYGTLGNRSKRADPRRSTSPSSGISDEVGTTSRRRRHRRHTASNDNHLQSTHNDYGRTVNTAGDRPAVSPPTRTVPVTITVRPPPPVQTPRTATEPLPTRQLSSNTQLPTPRRPETINTLTDPSNNNRAPARIDTTTPAAPAHHNTATITRNESSRQPETNSETKASTPAEKSTHHTSPKPSPPSPITTRNTKLEDDLEEEMTCPVCMSIMVGPHQITPCGHALCGGCGVQWILTRLASGDRVNCPTCREPVDPRNPLTPARAVGNMISKWIHNKIAFGGEWEGMADFKEREECWKIHKEHSPDGIIPSIPLTLRDTAATERGPIIVERTHDGTRVPPRDFPISHVTDMERRMDDVMNAFHRPDSINQNALETLRRARERISARDGTAVGISTPVASEILISRLAAILDRPTSDIAPYESERSQPMIRESGVHRRLPRVETSPQNESNGRLGEYEEILRARMRRRGRD